MHAILPLIQKTDFPALHRNRLETLQVNLGYRCNQTCLHCHVNAGPTRKEMMDEETVSLVLQILADNNIRTLDLTGGAPELHPMFRDIVTNATALDIRVIDRCNLTILFEPDQEGLAEFLAQHKVEVVGSLPCYSAKNLDEQRGNGVFEKSIAGLQLLNSLGYGHEGSGLVLNLVYNPLGPSLPPAQAPLQAKYKEELFEHFGVVFNQLFTVTNMPIQRFGSTLVSKGQFDGYMRLLKENYASANLENVMCRTLVSVDWQGYLFDCDFNQQLGISLPATNTLKNSRPHLKDFEQYANQGKPIRIADHCYGCTAGQGSSCGGALVE
jgi:radical SAM/Cys-rich protein